MKIKKRNKIKSRKKIENMKRTLQISTIASAASLMAFAALAQETPNPKTGGTEITREHSMRAMRAERLGRAEKASDLIGMEVKNYQGEKLGKVDDLVLDVETGRIVQVILSTGGIIGIGDTLHFESNQWPDLGQPSYADGVYRAYRVEPYFTTNAVSAPDNTVRNVRDRSNRTLTPFDQGNSAADRDTTAQIRKGILAGKGMSMNARNVKIITLDGQVTLRGPVNTAEEKRVIGEISDGIAKSENVDNQLEVKLTTSSNN